MIVKVLLLYKLMQAPRYQASQLTLVCRHFSHFTRAWSSSYGPDSSLSEETQPDEKFGARNLGEFGGVL